MRRALHDNEMRSGLGGSLVAKMPKPKTQKRNREKALPHAVEGKMILILLVVLLLIPTMPLLPLP